jgi:sortase A
VLKKDRNVPRKRSVDDLTVEELRHLLMEKQRAKRQARIEQYKRSGRAMIVEPQPSSTPVESFRSDVISSSEEAAEPPQVRRRTWLDRLLFLIEVGAVIGLLFIVLNGFNILRSLNKEASLAMVQPTFTPTPLISAVILPSGHTPPNSPGGVQFNDSEIPAHLKPLVQTLANQPIPTPSPEQAIRIQIPALGVDAPIVQGDGWEQLKKGVAQHIGSPNPGQKGNLILSAHNDVFGEIFRDLDKLKNGDKIVVFTNLRTYTYLVRQTQVVEPTRVEVMAPTREAVVTLISCYPYLVDNKRIVINAYLQDQS